MPVPGLNVFPTPPPRGPLVVRGQVEIRSGENVATVVGLTIDSLAPDTVNALRGAEGQPGLDGAPGLDAAPGPTGATGPVGPPGAQGPAGAEGFPGQDGRDGDVGPVGSTGPVGTTGPAGPTGPAGQDGLDGISGQDGLDGQMGPIGPQGVAGPTGPQGLAGPTGADGQDGRDGLDGQKGDTGAAGAPGATGSTGPAGADGPPGMDGVQGVDGLDGTPGAAGVAGAPGATGPTGPAGPQGPVGPQGLDGQDGRDGEQGPAGTNGVNGATGPAGVAGAILATQTVNFGTTAQTSGTFQITGLSGLTIGTNVAVSLAVNPADPTEAEQSCVITGIATSSSVITCYWNAIDVMQGTRIVQYLVPNTVSTTGPYAEQTTTLTGTQSDFALDALANSLILNATSGVLVITGIAGGVEGRRVWLRVGSTSDGAILKDESTSSAAANRMRAPTGKDYRMFVRDAVELYYTATRWVVVDRAREGNNTLAVTWAAQQDNLVIDGVDRVRVALTGSQILTGIVPRVANVDNDGQTCLLENNDDVDTKVILNNSTASSANNRIILPRNADFFLGPRQSMLLRYDGTTLAWKVAAHSGQQDRSDEIVYCDEDFLAAGTGGALGTTAIQVNKTNDAGWQAISSAAASGTWGNATPVVGHSGAVILTTSATANRIAALQRGNEGGTTPSPNNVPWGTVTEFTAWVQASATITSVTYCAGFGATSNAAALGAVSSVFFQYDAASSANWRCVSTDGAGASTVTTTTVPVVASNWFKLTYKQLNSGVVMFFINDVFVAFHTTNMPAAGLALGLMLHVQTATAANRDFTIDRVRVKVLQSALFT